MPTTLLIAAIGAHFGAVFIPSLHCFSSLSFKLPSLSLQWSGCIIVAVGLQDRLPRLTNCDKQIRYNAKKTTGRISLFSVNNCSGWPTHYSHWFQLRLQRAHHVQQLVCKSLSRAHTLGEELNVLQHLVYCWFHHPTRDLTCKKN